jgi:hypothetical protein
MVVTAFKSIAMEGNEDDDELTVEDFVLSVRWRSDNFSGIESQQEVWLRESLSWARLKYGECLELGKCAEVF